MITGTRAAILLEEFNRGLSLADSEIRDLIASLTFIEQFNRELGRSPEILYYANTIESLQRIQNARKEK